MCTRKPKKITKSVTAKAAKSKSKKTAPSNRAKKAKHEKAPDVTPNTCVLIFYSPY